MEHALCPLDASTSLSGPHIHETHYSYTDDNHHRKQAHVRVACPEGLSPTDEFYLWGLLSLTFAQPNPTHDFYATPYYCLRHLDGTIGGMNYAQFLSAITRLSTVTYRNDRFYDPVRGEHRNVGFGFLSYSLPLDPASSRAWRFAWDPIFFEFCQAASGALRFDFETYRDLDPASRRLYVVAPPSIIDGFRYEFISQGELHPFPDHLFQETRQRIQRITRKEVQNLRAYLAKVESIQGPYSIKGNHRSAGTRESGGNMQGCRMYRIRGDHPFAVVEHSASGQPSMARARNSKGSYQCLWPARAATT